MWFWNKKQKPLTLEEALAVARDPKTAPEQLAQLVKCPYAYVCTVAGKRLGVPVEKLEKWTGDIAEAADRKASQEEARLTVESKKNQKKAAAEEKALFLEFQNKVRAVRPDLSAPETVEDYHKVIEAIDLGKYWDKILPFISNEIRIESRGTSKYSYFRGAPTLPPGTEWPKDDQGKPLRFLAQIDLSEVAGLDADGWLPKSGGIFFFYQSETVLYQGSPVTLPYAENVGRSSRVIHYDGSLSGLMPVTPPGGVVNVLPKRSMEFSQKRIGLSDEDERVDEYALLSDHPEANRITQFFRWSHGLDSYKKLPGRPAPSDPNYGYAERHKLLGRANGIYCCVEDRVRDLVLRDKKGFSFSESENPVWRLLFQVNSEDRIGTDWEGYMGMGGAYYCIPEQDLRERRFDRCVCITISP